MRYMILSIITALSFTLSAQQKWTVWTEAASPGRVAEQRAGIVSWYHYNMTDYQKVDREALLYVNATSAFFKTEVFQFNEGILEIEANDSTHVFSLYAISNEIQLPRASFELLKQGEKAEFKFIPYRSKYLPNPDEPIYQVNYIFWLTGSAQSINAIRK